MEDKDDLIRITVKDFGVGFVPEEQVLGNGLRNMEKRVEDIGGDLEIISSPNNGTEIRILF